MRTWKEGKLSIGIKNNHEIQLMREGGKILGLVLYDLEQMIKPGITGMVLENQAAELMKKYKVEPSFLGYHGFPNILCISVNQQVVHGIPNDHYIFQDGDLVTVDCGVLHEGFHTDSAISKTAGKSNSDVERFMNAAEKALAKAIETAKPGIRVKVISGIIQDIVEKNGYSIVKDLCGHGIGQKIHEDPAVPNFRENNPGPILQPGMTIAIEPIISMGNPEVKVLKDGWTFVTCDNSLATQVEHTIAITEKGCEILTKRPN
jgi:methionyl aminopeptidase